MSTGACPSCPHGKGFHCPTCWPQQTAAKCPGCGAPSARDEQGLPCLCVECETNLIDSIERELSALDGTQISPPSY